MTEATFLGYLDEQIFNFGEKLHGFLRFYWLITKYKLNIVIQLSTLQSRIKETTDQVNSYRNVNCTLFFDPYFSVSDN